MKVTVINGNNRHGSTWHCMDAIRNELGRYGSVETTEFFLPKDMPHFCNGCFSCFLNGEHTCPHAQSVQPIAAAILEADLVILTSSVYALDVTGQLKALLDHLCYMWMSHRPDPGMFSKVGLTIATTAGAGLGHTSKTMRNSLKFWGAARVLSYKNPISAMKWSDVSEKKRVRLQKDAVRLAKKIAGYTQKAERLSEPLFRRFFFWLMTGMMSRNMWNLQDRKHWEDNGWIKAAPAGSGEKKPKHQS